MTDGEEESKGEGGFSKYRVVEKFKLNSQILVSKVHVHQELVYVGDCMKGLQVYAYVAATERILPIGRFYGASWCSTVFADERSCLYADDSKGLWASEQHKILAAYN